jgi:hypothetical protein
VGHALTMLQLLCDSWLSNRTRLAKYVVAKV